MKPPSRIALRRLAAAGRTSPHPSHQHPHQHHSPSSFTSLILPPSPLSLPVRSSGRRLIHSTARAPATVFPIHGQGPPPDPPQPAADSEQARVERWRKQAELLEKAKEARAEEAGAKSSSRNSRSSKESNKKKDGGADKAAALLRKRFWKDVHVREVDGAWEIHLDARPLRHPATKKVVRLPLSKHPLAAALALEWDLLVSAHHATRQHLIPLTSLVCRALDIAADDALHGAGAGADSIRAAVVKTVMRYLDTDSLLCWTPPPSSPEDVNNESKSESDPLFNSDPLSEEEQPAPRSLHEAQRRAASDVVSYLESRVWPGVSITPVLDGDSIVPRAQPPGTREVVEGWVSGLDAWELAGLERAVLAGKSLLGAVRLLVEWTEGPVNAGSSTRPGSVLHKHPRTHVHKFGVEQAARLASLEVDWQIRQWGEVEDTHDVEKVDLRRQLGSVVLLVTGTGSQ